MTACLSLTHAFPLATVALSNTGPTLAATPVSPRVQASVAILTCAPLDLISDPHHGSCHQKRHSDGYHPDRDRDGQAKPLSGVTGFLDAREQQ